jgi:hypothetical protein
MSALVRVDSWDDWTLELYAPRGPADRAVGYRLVTPERVLAAGATQLPLPQKEDVSLELDSDRAVRWVLWEIVREQGRAGEMSVSVGVQAWVEEFSAALEEGVLNRREACRRCGAAEVGPMSQDGSRDAGPLCVGCYQEMRENDDRVNAGE